MLDDLFFFLAFGTIEIWVGIDEVIVVGDIIVPGGRGVEEGRQWTRRRRCTGHEGIMLASWVDSRGGGGEGMRCG